MDKEKTYLEDHQELTWSDLKKFFILITILYGIAVLLYIFDFHGIQTDHIADAVKNNTTLIDGLI